MSAADHTDVTISRVASGHLYFTHSGDESAALVEHPLMLHKALIRWVEENPEAKVQTVLPITMGGWTVGFHLWYSQN